MDELEKEIEEGFREALKKGLLKIVGYKNGEPMYSLTKKGEKYVESMPIYNDMKEKADSINRGYS